MTESTRRAVVFGAGGAGLAAVLTACASYGSPATVVADPAEEPVGDEESSAAPRKKAKAPRALADTSDIPTGGGKIFESQKLVITQPTEGQFKAFSATCTHAGCTVASISNGVINCPCHGSKFKIEDGSVTQGPATEPLAAQEIKVEGDQITLA